MMRCSTPPPLPARIGPVEFGELGRMVAVPCELTRIVKRAGGVWEPGSRRWLLERRRIGPEIRAIEAATDPLFRGDARGDAIPPHLPDCGTHD
jgi:hypothetical protein